MDKNFNISKEIKKIIITAIAILFIFIISFLITTKIIIPKYFTNKPILYDRAYEQEHFGNYKA